MNRPPAPLVAFGFVLWLVAMALILSGCFAPPEHDCTTPGGLYLQHGETQCDEAFALQQRIEAEAEALGYGPHLLMGRLLYLRREELTARGSFDVNGHPARGLTYCVSSMMIVADLNSEPLARTAFAHEAFHLAQGCPWDQAAERECLAAGVSGFDCRQAAQHPQWAVAVYPAIARVNAVDGGAP